MPMRTTGPTRATACTAVIEIVEARPSDHPCAAKFVKTTATPIAAETAAPGPRKPGQRRRRPRRRATVRSPSTPSRARPLSQGVSVSHVDQVDRGADAEHPSEGTSRRNRATGRGASRHPRRRCRRAGCRSRSRPGWLPLTLPLGRVPALARRYRARPEARQRNATSVSAGQRRFPRDFVNPFTKSQRLPDPGARRSADPHFPAPRRPPGTDHLALGRLAARPEARDEVQPRSDRPAMNRIVPQTFTCGGTPMQVAP